MKKTFFLFLSFACPCYWSILSDEQVNDKTRSSGKWITDAECELQLNNSRRLITQNVQDL